MEETNTKKEEEVIDIDLKAPETEKAALAIQSVFRARNSFKKKINVSMSIIAKVSRIANIEKRVGNKSTRFTELIEESVNTFEICI